MKCESCQQAEATILFTTVSGDEKKEVHLCPQCAKTESERQQEIQAGGEPKVKPAQVKKVQVVVGQLATESKTTKPCSSCGMTYEEFRKVGRLGCPSCYAAFGSPLRRLLKRIHGADRHVGRVPGKAEDAGRKELTQLRQELDQAVQEEAYEKAAEIRDRIRRLQEGVPEA